MDLYVQKRNETVVPLNKNKIAGAIMKAVKASHSPESYFDINIADMLADKVYDDIVKFTVKNNTDSISYKDILDMTERALIKGGYSDTAKEYILYRQKKDEIINSRDSISKSIKDILLVQSNESDTKRENGNIDGDTAMGNMLQTGSAVAKNFYINNLVPKHIAKAHLSGDIHIHDLDFLKLTVTCCQIDFLRLARNGFNTGHGKIRPGKSILTAATLSAIAIQSDQNDCHGGQSIPNLDYALVPGLCHSFIKIVAKELANYCCTLYNGQYNRRIEMAKEIKDKIKQYMIDNDLEDFTFKEFDKYIVSKYSPFFPIGKDEKEIQAIKQFCIETLDIECFQAMEALIANLNTMHCLPAFQKIWIKDTNNRIRTISMSTLYDTFNEEEYQALSYNLKTLKWEWKRITKCVCNGIRDKLVMTRANTGESVYTTDNHKFISRDPETTGFKEAFPKTLSEVLINKNFTNGRHLYNESDPITDESSTWLEINYDGLVYDISVEDNENFITDNGILVHNSRAGAQV